MNCWLWQPFPDCDPKPNYGLFGLQLNMKNVALALNISYP